MIVSERLAILEKLLITSRMDLLSPRISWAKPNIFYNARFISSDIETVAILDVRESGFKSIDITTLPIDTSASARSPSSIGTITTSLLNIPSIVHRARSWFKPFISQFGFRPSTFSAPFYSRYDDIASTLPGVLWNRLTSIFAGISLDNAINPCGSSTAALPFTHITGLFALSI